MAPVDTTIADAGAPAVTVEGVSLSLSGLTLWGGGSPALQGLSAEVSVTGSHVVGKSSYAVKLDDTISVWEDVLFENNEVTQVLYTMGGSLTLRHSVFRNNAYTSGYSYGGRLLSVFGACDVSNNLFYGNYAKNFSPFISVSASDCAVYNNTIYGNVNFNSSDPMTVDIGGGAHFFNNIVSADGDLYGVRIGSAAQVDHNSIYAFDVVGVQDPYGLGSVSDNIEQDCLLTDPTGGNFQLQASSPCINAGNPATEYSDSDGSTGDLGAFGGPEGEWSPR